MVSYSKQTSSSPNPLARFSHGKRYDLSAQWTLRHLPKGGRLLDYGCGTGLLLNRVLESDPTAKVYGFEPYMSPKGAFPVFRTAAECTSERYDVITSFEVLEHLREPQTEEFFDVVDRQLAADGVLIVSVPLMHGPVLFLKALNAKYVKRTDWSYSIAEAIKCGIFLGNVPREDKALYLNHKGFDWRPLHRRLCSQYERVTHQFSPFSSLWWGFNSQYFGAFRRRARRGLVEPVDPRER